MATGPSDAEIFEALCAAGAVSVPSRTGIEVTSRPTKERVRNVAAIAAASLVLVVLVTALGMAVLR